MPVTLTTPEEAETWMTAAADEALKLQRPLQDGSVTPMKIEIEHECSCL
jgi:putative SOS response-associated peptidase YedK